MSKVLSTRRTIGAVQTYMDKVVGLGPIAYWPLNEGSGTTAACLINPAQNGTATGVTWANDVTGGFGTPAPYFDGANDYVDIFTAAFDAAFNGATGSMFIWCKVNAAGVWTDGADRMSMKLYDDANNSYHVRKTAANDRVLSRGEAGNGVIEIAHTPFSDTDWFHMGCTWSDGANDDEFKFYVGGTQRGATSAALNAWNGLGLDNANTLIGANTTVPALVWHGWLAHPVAFDYVVSDAAILGLANP